MDTKRREEFTCGHFLSRMHEGGGRDEKKGTGAGGKGTKIFFIWLRRGSETPLPIESKVKQVFIADIIGVLVVDQEERGDLLGAVGGVVGGGPLRQLHCLDPEGVMLVEETQLLQTALHAVGRKLLAHAARPAPDHARHGAVGRRGWRRDPPVAGMKHIIATAI